jgi:hypothetical protein
METAPAHHRQRVIVIVRGGSTLRRGWTLCHAEDDERGSSQVDMGHIHPLTGPVYALLCDHRPVGAQEHFCR